MVLTIPLRLYLPEDGDLIAETCSRVKIYIWILIVLYGYVVINPLAPNDVYISRTAQLTFTRCILNIYSTNIPILTEYFKHAAHSPFF